MFKEFREFAVRGNVMDMAVGIIIGAAFGKIVSSFVADLVMPPLGKLTGNVNFSDLFIDLSGQGFDSLAQAKHEREEAKRQLAEYTAKVDKARAQASAIVDEGRRDAEVLRHKIEETAKKEAAAMLDRAKREIGIAKDTAVKEIYTLSAKLATDMASKIIRKELSPHEHERLINESIGELEQVAT